MRRGSFGALAGAVSALLVACQGSGDSTPATTATGSRLVTYWRDDGTTAKAVPPDLGDTTIAALVLEGGTWREAPGTFADDGSFTIPDVGTGSYLLRLTTPTGTPRYYVSSARHVDLGYDEVGRVPSSLAASSTPVTVTVDGLEPSGATLKPFSTNARLSPTFVWAPATGATTGEFSLDFQGRMLPAAGDIVWLLQTNYEHITLADQRVATTTSVVRSGSVQVVDDLVDGASASVAFELAAPPQRTTTTRVVRSAFAALLPDMAPEGTITLDWSSVSIGAVAHGLANVSFNGVTVASTALPPGTDDVDLGTVSYPAPFPSWFTDVRTFQWITTPTFAAALGAPAVTTKIGYGAVRQERLEGAPADLRPRLGPARLPRVNGLDVRVAQAGVGLTPTLSWSPPSLGTPSRYSVTIYEQGSSLTSRATITLRGTSVVVPPGILETGKVYVALIGATSERGWDLAAPFRYALPRDSVPSFTAAFSP